MLGAVLLGATVLSDPIATAAQTVGATIIGPLDGSGNVKVHERGTAAVNVTNTSLPVREQGTVPVAQSGTWTVGLSGTAKVTSGDQTTLVGSYTGAPDGGGAFTEAVDADISNYKTVRVMANCFSGSACANIAVNVYAIVGSRSFLIDTFPMQNFLSQTRVFDALSGNIAVQLQNNNGGAIPNIGVAVFGRAN